MKLRNIIVIISALATGAMTSCDSDLNQAPVNLLSSDAFYQTASQCNQGVVGVYSDLRYVHVHEFWNLSEVRSDNLWVNPTTDGFREYSELGTFRADASLSTFESAWNMWYKMIYDANLVLSKLTNAQITNETIRSQFLNEMHFLRGWAYFELVRLFGDVPMITEPLSPSEANAVAQTDGRTIIDKVVIPDLTEALNLPDRGKLVDGLGKAVVGRADKEAAQGMLARVYMTLAGFPFNDTSAKTQAKTYLAQVLAHKADYWAPTIKEWRSQWLPSYANKYSVFAIQYTTGGYGNPAIFEMSPQVPPSYTDQRIFGNQIYLSKEVRYLMGDKVYANGNTDLRGAGYTYLDGYDAEGTTQQYTNSRENLAFDGGTHSVYVNTMFYKYLPTKRKIAALGASDAVESSMKDYYDWPVNYPVIRIEDMMLLNAELLAEEGNVSGALEPVNEIRTRAGLPAYDASSTTAAQALEYVKLERRLELFGEGVRWFDEIRYNTWQRDIKNLFQEYNNPTGTNQSDVADGRYLCPIPSNQMSIIPGLYKQNTGY